MILLINSPTSKPSEPPSGIARLAGALKFHNIKFQAVDFNIEGLYFLLQQSKATVQSQITQSQIIYNNTTSPARTQVRTIQNRVTHTKPAYDRWSLRASRKLDTNLKLIKNRLLYNDIDRYKQVTGDINRLLQTCTIDSSIKISIANYQDANLSPTTSMDLIWAYNHPEHNPYFSFFSSRIETLFMQHKPEIIGFSLNYMEQALTTFAIIGFIAKILPEAKIIIGGGLVTSWIRNLLMKELNWKNYFGNIIDSMVDGKGEAMLLKTVGVNNIKSSYTPYYEPFLQNNYLAPGIILPYSASQGCFWNKCSFCPQTAEKITYKPLPPDNVINEVGKLSKIVQPSLIHFLDNALSPRLLKLIGTGSLNIPWYGFARITPHLTNLKFCRNLKKSGCTMLKLGLESGDQDVLNHMNKGTCLVTISKALKTLKDAGIATYIYLLFGTYFETYEKAVNTMHFIAEHADEIDFLNLAIFNLPIFSNEANQLETSDFYKGDLSLYKNFKHPNGWDRYHVRNFIEKEFKKVPAIKKILKNNPPFFTSNHAPFFVTVHE